MPRPPSLAAACFAAIVAAGGALPDSPDPGWQDPPRVDWDSSAASLVLMLFEQNLVTAPDAASRGELRIAVIGDDRFGKAIAAIGARKRTRGEPPVPFRISSFAAADLIERKEDWSHCDVVVFATDDALVHSQVLAVMKDRRALLVSRRDDFVAKGGHLQLWLGKQKKPCYALDAKAVARLGFKLSEAVVRNSSRVDKER